MIISKHNEKILINRDTMFWNEKAECMNKEEKEKLQLKRLQETVKLAYENVEFYTKRFDEIGLKPEDIKTLKDIEKIPFTTKSDLREAYPLGLLAVPREEIVEGVELRLFAAGQVDVILVDIIADQRTGYRRVQELCRLLGDRRPDKCFEELPAGDGVV